MPRWRSSTTEIQGFQGLEGFDVPQDMVIVGQLGRPHGTAGAIRVVPTGPTLDTLGSGTKLVGRGPAGDRPLVLIDRSGAPPHIILRFEGVESRDQASALSGCSLLAPVDALPAIDDEATFYVRDLVGCAVFVEGSPAGVVVDIIPGAANDALEIEHDGARMLVPFITDAVSHLDVPARRVEVRAGFVNPAG